MISGNSITTLTFDCYGTLIDWEKGILQSFEPLLTKYNITITDNQLLETYAKFESELEQSDYQPYKKVLQELLLKFGKEFSFTPDQNEIEQFSISPMNWLPFDDSSSTLNKLQKRYELVVISNIDLDLFRESEKKLKIKFDKVITAEEVQTYKPSLKMFKKSIKVINQPIDQILHIAQSKYHDIAPAKEIGLKSIWVNRRYNNPGDGATPSTNIMADMEVQDLKSLLPILFH